MLSVSKVFFHAKSTYSLVSRVSVPLLSCFTISDVTHIVSETGNFQHSSFVAGGLVTSAGLISVKDGMIHTLSPLSGHYRFSSFVFAPIYDLI